MKIKLGLLQMNSQENLKENAKEIVRLIQSIPSQDLYIAPENSLYCGQSQFLFEAADEIQLQTLPWLKSQLIKLNLQGTVILGGIQVHRTSKKCVNQWWIFQNRKWRGSYIKRKLFKAQVPGSRSYDESLQFIAGKKAQLLAFKQGKETWKLGATICYDLRFPELFQQYSQQGASMCAVPSAFTQKTGEAHWHVLLRARAIENKFFIVAPAQVGHAPGGRQAYGHSLVVDPWGQVLLDAQDRVGAFAIECDLEEVKRVRTLIG